jgi:uncharacterized membrane protein SpoIIM required for sporulation
MDYFAFLYGAIAAILALLLAPLFPAGDTFLVSSLILTVISIYPVTRLLKLHILRERYAGFDIVDDFEMFEEKEKQDLKNVPSHVPLFVSFFLFSAGITVVYFITSYFSLVSLEMPGIFAHSFPESVFLEIFANNLQVSLFSWLLSFFYGAGAVLILALNAAVLGVFLSRIQNPAVLIHAVPEFSAFFIAAVAGGVISIAFFSKETRRTIEDNLPDSVRLLAIAILLLITAALLEVYVTPFFL